MESLNVTYLQGKILMYALSLDFWWHSECKKGIIHPAETLNSGSK
jgi:hypothetical protein